MEGILLPDLKWETDLMDHAIKTGPQKKKFKKTTLLIFFFLDIYLLHIITPLSCTSKQTAWTIEWLRIARTDTNGNTKKFRVQYV